MIVICLVILRAVWGAKEVPNFVSYMKVGEMGLCVHTHEIQLQLISMHLSGQIMRLHYLDKHFHNYILNFS